ncbi:hypothetical protein LI205_03170 [bacterium MSK18_59]|nr:hypothetical protein [bacterium MSK18_59]
MEEIYENPVLDYDELNSYIQGRTGLDYDTVANVLDLETEYMIKVGIIESQNPAEVEK